MVCRMCFLHSTNSMEIFGHVGKELNIAQIVTQHFWFEPKEDDLVSNSICSDCWQHVDNFHSFYLRVEEAQKSFYPIKGPVEFISAENIKAETEELPFDDIGDTHHDDNDQEEYVDPFIPVAVLKTDEPPASEEIRPKRRRSQKYIKKESDEELSEAEEKPKITRKNKKLNSRTKVKSQKSKRVSRKKDENSEYEGNHSDGDDIYSDSGDDGNKPLSEYIKKSKEDDDRIAQFMKLSCDLCGVEARVFAEIKRHFREVHQKRGYIVCCNKKLYKRVLILDHVNKHLDPEYFKCEECNKTFADKQCLKRHMLMHDPGNSKIYKCDECPKQFFIEKLLERHKLIHVPLEQRHHFCDQCNKPFQTEYLLKLHKRYVHEKANGRMCHICAKVIRGKKEFQKHQLEHAGIIEPKLQCQVCGAWLKNKQSLGRHMVLHTDSNEHVCNICGKISPTYRAMRSHERYMHAARRTFQCSVCEKAFKNAIMLKEHMTTHTGEILYTCPHCPKTFNSNANMYSHRKKAHPQEWEECRRNRQSQSGNKINPTIQESIIPTDNSNNVAI